MWADLAHTQERWIGGRLMDHDAVTQPTTITGITLTGRHTEQQLTIHGQAFDWALRTRYLGVDVDPHDPTALVLRGFGMACTITPAPEKVS